MARRRLRHDRGRGEQKQKDRDRSSAEHGFLRNRIVADPCSPSEWAAADGQKTAMLGDLDRWIDWHLPKTRADDANSCQNLPRSPGFMGPGAYAARNI
jgi:hypothetical protein